MASPYSNWSTQEWEEALYPECASSNYAKSVGLDTITKTLSVIGVSSSAQAAASGFVLIRPHVKGRRRGLWVHRDNLPELYAIAQRIARERTSKEQEGEEKARKLRERKLHEAQRVIKKFSYLPDGAEATFLDWAQFSKLKDITYQRALDLLKPAFLTELNKHMPADMHVDVKRANVALGCTTIEHSISGHPFSRIIDLGTYELTRGTWDSIRQGDLEGAARTVLNEANAKRESAARQALERTHSLASVAAEIIEALPEQHRTRAIQAALKDLSRQTCSQNSLKLKIRNAHISSAWRYAKKHTQKRTPTLRMERSGIFSVSQNRPVTLEIDGESYTVRLDVLVREQDWTEHLLSFSPEGFAQFVERELARLVQAQEGKWRTLEATANELLHGAECQPFYDTEGLRREIREHVSTAVSRASTTALRRALAHIRRTNSTLLKAAKEKEVVHHALSARNLHSYKDFFTTARSLGRRLVLYAGPTNSGKTFHALNHLVQGETGVYLAPLRLLALEGQEEIIKRGKDSSFLTGEERDIRPGAPFTASTIEMLDLERVVDVAVIDEVQMIADRHRGWAWVQALVGAPAKTVVMTGSMDCIAFVEKLASYLDEPLEIHLLDRHTPLEALKKPLTLEQVTPRTAIVAFSRRDVLGLKQELENRYSVAVIYGNLSPEVRREEARRFRSGEAQVLVATDAIAMGLNLPIRQILFYETRKWNGEREVRLTPSEVLQIAGRAGRFGQYEKGFAGALASEKSNQYIAKIIHKGSPPALKESALVAPSLEHVRALAEALGSNRLTDALELFHRRMEFDTSMLSSGIPEGMMKLAYMVDRYKAEISLRDRFTLACAPLDTRQEETLESYRRWVGNFAGDSPTPAPQLSDLYLRKGATAKSDQELHRAEIHVKMYTAYAWLAYRYPALFPDLERCNEYRGALNTFIEQSLRKKGVRRKCRECGGNLPSLARHSICDRCHRSRWRHDIW